MTASRVPLALPRARAVEEPLVRHLPDDAVLTDQLLAPLWRPSRVWWALFAISGAGTLLFLALVYYTFARGIGLWGNNIPVAWAYAITDFVW